MEQLLDIARDYDPGQWILWAGAGVSRPGPTSLPLGDELTRFSILQTCGEEFSARLERVWTRAGRTCREIAPAVPLPPLPRLESVLGAIGAVEQEAPDADLAFLPAFRSFAAAPPNQNHVLLARVLRRGALVVTTNFDLGIGRAAGLDEGRCRLIQSVGMVRLYAPDSGTGLLVHVHGGADEPQTLGATLRQVKEGLAPEVKKLLARRLQAGSALIWLGYSGSDAFDVSPFFAGQEPRAWPRSASIFVQHQTAAVPPQARSLAAGFGRSVEGRAETTSFLAALASHDPAPCDGAFDWQKEFLYALGRFRCTEARPILACAVANELGLNVDKVLPGAFDAADAKNPGYTPRRYHQVLALAGRGRGVPSKEEEHHRVGGGGQGDLLGYHYARGNLARALPLALTVAEITTLAAEPGPIDWKPYTSMSVHGRILLAPYLRRPWLKPRGSELRRVEALVCAAAGLAERSLADVGAVHQVVTAQRFLILLRALQNGTLDPALERRVLTLYADQSNLQGFVSASRDFAIARALAMRHRRPHSALWTTAMSLVRLSSELARTIGDRSGLRRAHLAQALLAWTRLAAAVPVRRH